MTNSNIEMEFAPLANPPITEALIQFQVSAQEPITLQKLTLVKEATGKEFPISEERYGGTFIFDLASPESARGQGEPQGFLVRSEDKLYAAQYMLDRFSFSRLAPYTSWDDLSKRTSRLWTIYRDITKADHIKGLSVRYINRILLPFPIMDFSEYFAKPIEIPEKLPQGVAKYMVRILLPDREQGLMANIQQVLEGTTEGNKASIIFDVDAFMPVDLSSQNDEAIWSNFEKLHIYKNRIFFFSMTDKTLGLFK